MLKTACKSLCSIAITLKDAYFRHCERSEAIQKICLKLDCFAMLAMTRKQGIRLSKSFGYILFLVFGMIPSAFANLEDVPSFADIANTLVSGTDVVTRLLLAAAVVMGVGFIIFAFSTFRQHRMTPKLVPLDRPILYFVLGLSLCCLPYLGELFGAQTYSTLDLKKAKSQIFSSRKQSTVENHYTWDLDAPIETVETHR